MFGVMQDTHEENRVYPIEQEVNGVGREAVLSPNAALQKRK